jgi:hypothetical protein
MAGPAESFRYFFLIFRRPAFEPVEVRREGKTLKLSFLDRLLLEGETCAREAGDRLKDRICERIFPDLAAGFIQLYAEARDLLPVKESHGYFEVSLTNLKTTIANAAGAALHLRVSLGVQTVHRQGEAGDCRRKTP